MQPASDGASSCLTDADARELSVIALIVNAPRSGRLAVAVDDGLLSLLHDHVTTWLTVLAHLLVALAGDGESIDRAAIEKKLRDARGRIKQE